MGESLPHQTLSDALDDDGLPFDWVLLAQSVAVHSPLWLAMIGIVPRREVAKWAKAPYIPGHGTDFFAWNDSVFEAHVCFTKDDVCRMRRALEIPDLITFERPRKERPGSRLGDIRGGLGLLCVPHPHEIGWLALVTPSPTHVPNRPPGRQSLAPPHSSFFSEWEQNQILLPLFGSGKTEKIGAAQNRQDGSQSGQMEKVDRPFWGF